MATRIPRENLHSRQRKSQGSDSLGFLQDTMNENKALRERIEALELQQSKCEEYHALAEEAKVRIQQVHEESLKKADEIILNMAEKHQREIMLHVNERVDLEKRLSEEITSLKDDIGQLKQAVKSKDEVILANSNQQQKIDMMCRDQQKSDSEITRLRAKLDKFQTIKDSNLEEGAKVIESLREENFKLSDEFDAMKQQNLELKLKVENVERELQEQRAIEITQDIIDVLTTKLEKTSNENMFLLKKGNESIVRIEELKEENLKLEREIQMLMAKLCKITNEKEELGSAYDKSLEDLSNLRKMQISSPVSSKSNFRDFVELRRELQLLRDENKLLKETLKTGMSRMTSHSGSNDGFMALRDSNSVHTNSIHTNSVHTKSEHTNIGGSLSDTNSVQSCKVLSVKCPPVVRKEKSMVQNPVSLRKNDAKMVHSSSAIQ